ncbi:MAG: class I SAM-dependent methyltransferase, partial [Neisseria sp.]|nr:class I SAM-dependent methyltransferase [Neisseria sp.]
MSSPLLPILPFAHQLLRAHLREGDTALDGTAGNGHDTLLLAECVGRQGKVYAFDVQQAALATTEGRLNNAGLRHRVELIAAGHERAAEFVPQGIAAAVFNFGWLPGSDKSITTQAETSVAALQAAVSLLKNGG